MIMAVLSMASEEDSKPIFHDFLGSQKSIVLPSKTTEVSPVASASAGASSGRRGGPISTTSDLGSERQAGNHFEGVPYYGLRSDFSGSEMNNLFAGKKRSNSDYVFMGSSRGGIPQTGPDNIESLHLMKILRQGSCGERPRRSHDEEKFFNSQPNRPTSSSLLLQPPTGCKTDATSSKRDQPMGVGHTPQYSVRMGKFASLVHQVPSNRLRDANAGPSILSQLAADEGSRTGMRGSGILSSTNVNNGASDRNPSCLMLPSGIRPKSVTIVSGPESSLQSSRCGLTSGSRQMTIFYGGQAHVFDDVHQSKADVIMTLAGSNGGSWSTTFSPKPSDSSTPNAEDEVGISTTLGLLRETCGRPSSMGSFSDAFGSVDRISTIPGGFCNTTTNAGVAVKEAEPDTV